MKFFGTHRIRRSCVIFASVLLALPVATMAAAEEPRGWIVRAGPQVSGVIPIGAYRPIGGGTDVSLGLTATVSRGGLPFTLRFSVGTGGNSQTFPDSNALFADGTPWGDPVDVFVGNSVGWTTLGVQWDPNPDRSGVYAFVTAGLMSLSSDANPEVMDLVLPDKPVLPSGSTSFCMTAGAGSRWAWGKRRTHALSAEVEVLFGGKGDYVVSPAIASDFGNTLFPVSRANITAWVLQVGYTYAIRWGGGR